MIDAPTPRNNPLGNLAASGGKMVASIEKK